MARVDGHDRHEHQTVGLGIEQEAGAEVHAHRQGPRGGGQRGRGTRAGAPCRSARAGSVARGLPSRRGVMLGCCCCGGVTGGHR